MNRPISSLRPPQGIANEQTPMRELLYRKSIDTLHREIVIIEEQVEALFSRLKPFMRFPVEHDPDSKIEPEMPPAPEAIEELRNMVRCVSRSNLKLSEMISLLEI